MRRQTLSMNPMPPTFDAFFRQATATEQYPPGNAPSPRLRSRRQG